MYYTHYKFVWHLKARSIIRTKKWTMANKRLWILFIVFTFVKIQYLLSKIIVITILLLFFILENVGLKMVRAKRFDVSNMMKIQKRENNNSLFFIIMIVLITILFKSILLNFTTYFSYYDVWYITHIIWNAFQCVTYFWHGKVLLKTNAKHIYLMHKYK